MNKKYRYLMTLLLTVSPIVIAKEKHREKPNYHDPHLFSFAVVADAPYGDENTPAFDNVINDINKDRSINFVFHGGDIKSGGTECSDERLQSRFTQYQKINRPFIYTPGDNEWTDCHRTNNGQYNPLERLSFIRSLFYPNPRYTTGGKKMRVTSQSDSSGYDKYIENTMFTRSNVVFSAVHVVGSNNNLSPWSGIDAEDSFETPREDRYNEFVEREQASIAWLKQTFVKAKRTHAQGVFILIHANPQLNIDYTDDKRAGFNRFLNELFLQTKSFGKPVLLAHGDSHVFFTDKPKVVPWYADGTMLTQNDERNDVANLTRLQTFGDTPQHWVKVTIAPETEDLFVIEPQFVKANLN